MLTQGPCKLQRVHLQRPIEQFILFARDHDTGNDFPCIREVKMQRFRNTRIPTAPRRLANLCTDTSKRHIDCSNKNGNIAARVKNEYFSNWTSPALVVRILTLEIYLAIYSRKTMAFRTKTSEQIVETFVNSFKSAVCPPDGRTVFREKLPPNGG